MENVCAQEVEDVLRKHPAVFDCALIGVEDQRFGEAVAAAIVLNPGASLSDEPASPTSLPLRRASLSAEPASPPRNRLPTAAAAFQAIKSRAM